MNNTQSLLYFVSNCYILMVCMNTSQPDNKHGFFLAILGSLFWGRKQGKGKLINFVKLLQVRKVRILHALISLIPNQKIRARSWPYKQYSLHLY